jgi:hypothetical protein
MAAAGAVAAAGSLENVASKPYLATVKNVLKMLRVKMGKSFKMLLDSLSDQRLV